MLERCRRSCRGCKARLSHFSCCRLLLLATDRAVMLRHRVATGHGYNLTSSQIVMTLRCLQHLRKIYQIKALLIWRHGKGHLPPGNMQGTFRHIKLCLHCPQKRVGDKKWCGTFNDLYPHPTFSKWNEQGPKTSKCSVVSKSENGVRPPTFHLRTQSRRQGLKQCAHSLLADHGFAGSSVNDA